MDDLITIPEAAEIMGHSDPTTLYAAGRAWLAWRAKADAGEEAGPEVGLRVHQVGPKTRLTTHTWLEEYRNRLRSGGYRRDEAKQPSMNESNAVKQ